MNLKRILDRNFVCKFFLHKTLQHLSLSNKTPKTLRVELVYILCSELQTKDLVVKPFFGCLD